MAADRNQAIAAALRQFHATPLELKISGVELDKPGLPVADALQTLRDKPREEPRRLAFWIFYHTLLRLGAEETVEELRPRPQLNVFLSKQRRADQEFRFRLAAKRGAERFYANYCRFHGI